MFRPILVALLFLVGSETYAAPQDWMKQDNPNELGKFVAVANDDCSITQEELNKAVDGEFLRARIKPVTSFSLHLNVELTCIKVKNMNNSVLGVAMNYRVMFGTLKGASFVSYEAATYGNLQISSSESKEYRLNSVRNAVSNALTDYLKANFE